MRLKYKINFCTGRAQQEYVVVELLVDPKFVLRMIDFKYSFRLSEETSLLTYSC